MVTTWVGSTPARPQGVGREDLSRLRGRRGREDDGVGGLRAGVEPDGQGVAGRRNEFDVVRGGTGRHHDRSEELVEHRVRRLVL